MHQMCLLLALMGCSRGAGEGNTAGNEPPQQAFLTLLEVIRERREEGTF